MRRFWCTNLLETRLRMWPQPKSSAVQVRAALERAEPISGPEVERLSGGVETEAL
jgi:hypothetical protein